MYRTDVRPAIKQQGHGSRVSVVGRAAESAFAGGMDVRTLVEEFSYEAGVAIAGCLYMPIVEEELFEY